MKFHIINCTCCFYICTTIPFIFGSLVFATTSAVGLVYLGSAAVLGAIFVALAWNLKGDITTKRARTLYLFSLLYLALLFVAMIADSKLYY